MDKTRHKKNDVRTTAVFGGGCFWCTEAVFRMIRGVFSVEPGYAGGSIANPTYEAVCEGNTGHTEVVRIAYDPALISYRDLLAIFFGSHDPTTPNRQGNDVGEQYRSVIFTNNDEEVSEAKKFIAELNASSEFGSPVVTAVEPLANFYPAEDYHKDYFARNPEKAYCQLVINPKLDKAKQRFAALLAKQD